MSSPDEQEIETTAEEAAANFYRGRGITSVKPPPEVVHTTRWVGSLGEGAGKSGGEMPDTDYGVALNVAATLKGKILYTPEGGWLFWNDEKHLWEFNTPRVTAMVGKLMREDARCQVWHRVKDGYAPGNPTIALVKGVMSMLETDLRIAVSLTDFDKDPYSINTPEGLIDLKTGGPMFGLFTINEEGDEVDLGNPLVLKTTTVAPRPGKAERWEKVLSDAFPGDRQMQAYIEKVLALSLLGGQDVQQFWMFAGVAGSGKSTLLNTVKDLLGEDVRTGYATPVQPEFLLSTGSNPHPEEFARLIGKRMLVSSETDARKPFASARVKALTGGDSMTGSFKYKTSFTFKPSGTLFLATNYRPNVARDDVGFWRRFREVTFKHKPPVEIPGLVNEMVTREGPAILWRLMEHVQEFLNGTEIKHPGAVLDATLGNQDEQDLVAQFLEDEADGDVEFGQPGSKYTNQKYIYTSFAFWCKQQRVTPPPRKQVFAQLVEEGHVRKGPVHGLRWFDGLRLYEPVDMNGKPVDQF